MGYIPIDIRSSVLKWGSREKSREYRTWKETRVRGAGKVAWQNS